MENVTVWQNGVTQKEFKADNTTNTTTSTTPTNIMIYKILGYKNS